VEKLEVWRYWCSGGVVQWRCLIICMIVVGGFNCARPYLLTVLASVKCWLGSLQFRYWCSGGVVQWRLEGVEEWRRVCRVWVFP
jgi:hypothetical protein